MLIWEKSITYSVGDEKISKKKTFGEYFSEYIDTVAVKTIAESG